MRGRSVLIAGAGTMGRGIAELMAQAGFEVQLWDRRPAALGRSSAAIERSLRREMIEGRLDPERLEEALERVRLISDLRVVHPRTDLAVEAVVEELDAKKNILRRMEELLPEAWYVTHAAGLRVGELAKALSRPERLVGMRFFSPVRETLLVEVVPWAHTSNEWLRRVVAISECDLGKRTIVVKDSPGGVTTRLSVALMLEAMRVAEEGVAIAADIDRAMETGLRHPMGPLRQADSMGLDVILDIARAIRAELALPLFEAPPILERMVREGKLGRKSGQGFFRYS